MKKILLITAYAFYALTSYSQFGNAVEISNNGPAYSSVHPMDFDNDGDMDVLSTDGSTGGDSGDWYWNFYTGTLVAQNFTLSENVGTNNFVNHTLIALNAPQYWTFGDLSGDGLLDFVYAGQFNGSATSYKIFYRENLGNFSFGVDELVFELPAYDAPNVWDFWFSRVAIGDVNSDGDNEIVALYNGTLGDLDSYNNWENIYMIDYESGIFNAPVLLDMSLNSVGACGCPDEISDLIIMDYNNDGWNDVIFQRFVGDGNEMMVHLALGAGVFGNDPNAPGSYNYLYSYSWDIADMQGDGQNNLVGIDPNIGYLEVSDPDFLWTVSPSFNPVIDAAPGLAALDIDADTDCDIVVPTISGELVIFEQDDLWNTAATDLVLNYSVFDPGIPYDVTAMSRMDYDNDGDQDLVIIAEGHIYVVPIDNTIDNFATLQINGYLDDNANGVFDSGENSYNNFSAEIIASNDDINSYFTQSGEIDANLVPNNYEVNVIDNFGAYNLGIAMPLNVTLADVSADMTIDVPFVVDGTPTSAVDAYLFSWSGVCDGPSVNHYINVMNTDGLVADGIITYTLDPVHTFISSVPAATTVSGNIISWEFFGLAPNDVLQIVVNVSSAPLASLGSEVTNTLNVQLIDVNGNVSFDINEYGQYLVGCSYDPNQMTENFGFTDEGYILDVDQLEYTIQFQNLGNAPAIDVRIENQLSDLLQRSTLQPIASSHPYDLIIDENDNAIFTFNGINLPDATNNEAESHGFITYRILPIEGLAPQTVINNTAEIFFDFNPPVLTNVEVNTIYNCADLEQATLSETTVCSGEEIALSNSAIWIENLTWTFNDELVGNSDFVFVLNENGSMAMNASNALCSFSESFELIAEIALSDFSSVGNLLSAVDAISYQWYLNGSEIVGANEQTFLIAETGNYSVMITDVNGCTATSNQQAVVFIGLQENVVSLFSIYPNPAQNEFWISCDVNMSGKTLRVVNAFGQQMGDTYRLNGSRMRVDCSSWASGIYQLQVGNDSARLVID